VSTIDVSVVIPVYNSAGVVGETIGRTAACLDTLNVRYEIVAVNDGSTDASWAVLEALARAHPGVVAVDLARNCGQHAALLCGLRRARGRLVVTMDDDLQNPPEEIPALLAKAAEGHDVVFGRFRQKRHGRVRRAGAVAVRLLDRFLFRAPAGVAGSNFRVMSREVVERICRHPTVHPYVRGLAFLYATSPANTWVEHHPRRHGRSSYGARELAMFVWRIVAGHAGLRAGTLAGAGVAVALAGIGVASAAGRGAVEWSRPAARVAAACGAAGLGLAALAALAAVRARRASVPVVPVRRVVGGGDGAVG
jgi:glycosyltransferase involved in cell wall biosynthesis